MVIQTFPQSLLEQSSYIERIGGPTFLHVHDASPADCTSLDSRLATSIIWNTSLVNQELIVPTRILHQALLTLRTSADYHKTKLSHITKTLIIIGLTELSFPSTYLNHPSQSTAPLQDLTTCR